MRYQFSENIQRGILYLAKSDINFFVQIVNLVKPEFFENEPHSKILQVIKKYYEKYKQLPKDEFILEDLREELLSSESENIEVYSDEIKEINNIDLDAVANDEYYLDLIEKFAKRQALLEAIVGSIDEIKKGNIGLVEEKIKKAVMISRHIDNGQLYFEDIKERWERIINGVSGEKTKTGFPAFDDSLDGGLGRKEIAMVVAPPGVGKSIALVKHGMVALTEGKKVLHITLEMREDLVGQRYDSVLTNIPQSQLKYKGTLLQERLGKFQEKFGGKLIIKEFPTTQCNANIVRAFLLQLNNYLNFKPDVLIVDYLELMRPTTEGLTEYAAQQRITEELRGIGVESNILVITATQTNREGRRVTLITDSELADSYGKIRVCDFAYSINQTEEEFNANRARLYVIKSRNGRQRFVVNIKVDYNTLKMSQLATPEVIEAALND